MKVTHKKDDLLVMALALASVMSPLCILLEMNMFQSSEHQSPHFKHGYTLKSRPVVALCLQTYMHEQYNFRCIFGFSAEARKHRRSARACMF